MQGSDYSGSWTMIRTSKGFKQNSELICLLWLGNHSGSGEKDGF